MYIEDLFIKLHLKCRVNKFDEHVVESLSTQLFGGTGFTEKQSLLALRILKRYSKSLSQHLTVDITPFIDTPSFKFTIRKVTYNKSVSVIDYPNWGRGIKVEFPYNEDKIAAIRKERDALAFASWDGNERAWMFSLDERNIQFLTSLLSNDNFHFDEEFAGYIAQVKEITKNVENHVPMLTVENGSPKYQNVSRFVPKMVSNDVISAIFEARNAGIFTWDENVDQYLDSINLSPVIRKFLTSEKVGTFEIDSAKHSIDCLKEIVTHSQPTLFVIPGGSESRLTMTVYNFLSSMGYSNDEMSVMFRLPNSDGKEFNDFVKNCGLNNPITDKTKFVFVSIKMPKPVLKSKIQFNSVISLGRSNVHYTIREFFKNRHNLIYYCEPNKQKEFNFGNL